MILFFIKSAKMLLIYIRPLQVVVLFLVRVFLQYTGGFNHYSIIAVYHVHPRNVTMLTAAAPYSITGEKFKSRFLRDKLEV